MRTTTSSINQSDAFLNTTRCGIKPNIKIKRIYIFIFSVKKWGGVCLCRSSYHNACFLWLPGWRFAVAKVLLACPCAVSRWFPKSISHLEHIWSLKCMYVELDFRPVRFDSGWGYKLYQKIDKVSCLQNLKMRNALAASWNPISIR